MALVHEPPECREITGDHRLDGARDPDLLTEDVPSAVARLRGRGVDFVDSSDLHPDDRGALTRSELGGLAFELVHRDG